MIIDTEMCYATEIIPRIDPLKLLTCLKVLLAPNGGIRSANEVKRLAELMAKYSKKLVSKCIYIQILKSTDTELLGKFMGVGGWLLTHMWLNDAIKAANWPLVQEILELLLLCPVDVQRLRSNTAPKLVKGLSKDGGNEGVRILATKLVEQWLKVVKGETMAASELANNAQIASTPKEAGGNGLVPSAIIIQSDKKVADGSSEQVVAPSAETVSATLTSPTKLKSDDPLVYKIVVKDGKQILAKIVNSGTPNDPLDTSSVENKTEKGENSVDGVSNEEKSSGSLEDKQSNKENEGKSSESQDKLTDKDSDKEKSRSKDKDRHRDHKSSSSSRHKSSPSSSSKSSSKSSSSSSRSKSSHNSSSSSSSSKHKDKESSDKDRHKSSSSKSSSSSRDKDKSRSRDKDSDRSHSSSDRDRSRSDRDKDKDKEKSSDKDKDKSSDKDKDKSQSSDKDNGSPMLIDKLGKIPKKPKEDEPVVTSITIPSKKASMSIEIRRGDPNRPKTVKTYNSQFRSHGLSEEAPPPPSRKGLKKPPTQSIPGTSIPSTLLVKRSSPPPMPATISSPTTVKELLPPAEKKLKIDLTTAPATEKPGAVKFIAPKPKRTATADAGKTPLCALCMVRANPAG